MIIQTEHLTKRYGRHEAVKDISLAVPEGAALALIGANGAGKTTTLRMLLNLAQPSTGDARVLGKDSRELSATDLARIGYVSENQKLPDGLTVAQYFDYLRPLYPTWDGGLEADLRARFDLPADRKLGKLSHGTRLKTVLAAALPFHPTVLILDEPLSGLDPLVRDEVMEGLLANAADTTILISSHELAEIEGFATHVAFIDRGRLLFQEPMEALTGRFRDSQHHPGRRGGHSLGPAQDLAGAAPGGSHPAVHRHRLRWRRGARRHRPPPWARSNPSTRGACRCATSPKP